MKRLFRGLRREEPDRRYDAVVIGAGIGGLVLSNLLAREGLRTLLVEQHYMVGGYCSTFRRGGYTFDAATHFYPLLGNPETLTGGLLDELGVRTGWVRMDPVDTFHFPDGSRFDVPAEFETYLARVKERFPEEADALDRFFGEVRRVYLLGLLEYFRGRRTDRLAAYRHLSVREALDRHFRDPKLKLLLTADCPHWGSRPARTSFVFDSMLRLSYFLGNYYPERGSQAFGDELARTFEGQGGEILMSSRVDRILVEDGRAVGIAAETVRGPLRGRREIGADVVISNGDLRLTFEELLGPDHVSAAQRETVRSLRPSFPCFLTHIGLEGVDPKVLERAQGYYWSSWDPERVGKDGLICKIFSPTLYEPRLAPEGGQIVILQKVLEMDFWDAEDRDQHRAEVEDLVTSHLERVIPGIEDHVVVRLSATADTSRRFTLNQRGAMLGWEMAPDQLGESRPGIEGPVEGLYLVGHWTRPGGGITPVIVSALHVARAITGSRWDRRGWPGSAGAGASAPAVEAIR